MPIEKAVHSANIRVYRQQTTESDPTEVGVKSQAWHQKVAGERVVKSVYIFEILQSEAVVESKFLKARSSELFWSPGGAFFAVPRRPKKS